MLQPSTVYYSSSQSIAVSDVSMQKTTFEVPKMDCAAEERLVRMALARRRDVRNIDADLPARQLTVVP